MIDTCSCMILNYNDAKIVKKLVTEIENYPVFNHIVVVDNCSTDDSYADLQSLVSEKVTVIKTDKNGGYDFCHSTRY